MVVFKWLVNLLIFYSLHKMLELLTVSSMTTLVLHALAVNSTSITLTENNDIHNWCESGDDCKLRCGITALNSNLRMGTLRTSMKIMLFTRAVWVSAGSLHFYQNFINNSARYGNGGTICAGANSLFSFIVTTVKPQNRGHFGDGPFVLCREVVLFSEVLY